MNLCEQRNLEKITQIGIEENLTHNFEKKIPKAWHFSVFLTGFFIP